MRRVVLDTGVLVSATLVPLGPPGQLLHAWRELRYELVISEVILQEFARVLRYPRIRRKYVIPEAVIDELQALLATEGRLVPVSADVSDSNIRDPSDSHVLACAVAGEADFIVSSDQDLLGLGEYRRIPILAVRAALETLASS